MRAALTRHDDLLASRFAEAGGRVFKHTGDGVCAVFPAARPALAAALAAQLDVTAENWELPRPLRVRMGLHVGEAEEREGDYLGPALNRCARLTTAAHGSQVLLSAAAAERVSRDLPAGARLRELGSCRLRDLIEPEIVFQLIHPDLPRDFPELRGLASYPNNLPVQPTPLLGRDDELVELKGLLDRARLLTLTGTGGVGKTRLALHLGAEVLPAFPDGVWFVDLAPVTDPALVEQAALSALGLTEEPTQPLRAQLLEHLRSREGLLILDNCEHLIHACAELAEFVLRACPRVRLLATSREPLRVPGETAWRVPSLLCSHPDPQPLEDGSFTLCQCQAVRLFIERATAARPDFTVTGGNAQAVEQVCRRLDGIPLAIELAAARVRAMPVEEIARQLDDRFRLLTGGSRTALPRQQTLRALVDWSYDLLTEAERALFACLSVFAGGWRLEAAEAVCGLCGVDIRDVLFSLVDKSLVLIEESGGEMRYRFLETVRQYASERLEGLAHAGECGGRHSAYYTALAEERVPGLQGAAPAEPLAQLSRELHNLRAALEWAKGRPDQVARALRLTSMLCSVWDVLGLRREARRQLEDALALSASGTAPKALRSTILRSLIGEAVKEGDPAKAHRFGVELLALSREIGDCGELLGVVCLVGHAAREVGDEGTFRRLGAVLDEIEPRLSDPLLQYNARVSRAWLAQMDYAYDVALEHAEAALVLANGLDSHFLQLNQLRAVGVLSCALGDYARSRYFLGQALQLALTPSVPDCEANCRTSLGGVLAAEGAWAEAREQYDTALRLARQTGARQTELIALNGLGGTLLRLEGPDDAEHALEEGMALCAASDSSALERFFLASLGRVAQARGQADRADAFFREALARARSASDRVPVAECLESLGSLAAAEGDARRAIRLLGAGEALRDRLGAPRFPACTPEFDEALAAARRLLGEEAFEPAWAEALASEPDEVVQEAIASDESPPEASTTPSSRRRPPGCAP